MLSKKYYYYIQFFNKLEQKMFQSRQIQNQYSQYSSLREKNCVSIGCMPPQQFQGIIATIKQHKAQDIYCREKLPETNLEGESLQYQQYQKGYQQNVRRKLPNPFESSVHKVFKSRLVFIMSFQLIGIFCHSFTPFLLYLLYINIVNQKIHSFTNKIVVAAIIIFRILRIICSYYGEMKLNELGLNMYRLVTKAIIQKSLKCSPISNKNISMKQLTKIMQTDCMIIMGYPATLAMGLDNTLNQIISTGIIIYVSGMAGLFGILFLFITLFLRLLLKKQVDSIGKTLENLSNNRVKATIQIFNIIKFIKANALQSCYFNKLRQLRVKEVAQIKKKLFIQTIQNAAHITKFLALVVTCKILVATGAPFDVEIVFTVCICISFTNPQGIINAVAYLGTIQTSFNYIEAFMEQQNLDASHVKIGKDLCSIYAIQIQNGNFSWNEEDTITGQINVSHLTDINIKIKKGEFIAIVGGYGSGKSSFINCIMGQMNIKGNPSITISGSIAYASQSPWIMNDTIRNNILFGSYYNQKRYAQAVKFASLQSDLLMFAKGDLTIIGKRGSTLSGGQRARVSLARALYSNADIYILDDILSAVDAHVGAFLFSMGIKRYLKDKTILLITHSLYYVSYADRILLFQNGQISAQGTYQQVQSHPIFAKIETSALRTSQSYQHILSRSLNFKQVGFLMIPDQLERQIGAFESFSIYIQRNSGLPFALLIIIYIAIISGVSSYSQIHLYGWSLSPVAQDDFYFYIQIIINVSIVSLTILLGLVLHFSKIYQSLHDDMIKSLLFSPFSYFQKVPTDKIINRISNDLGINDKIITSEFNFSLVHFRILFCALFNIFYVYVHFNNYFYFIIFSLFMAIIFYFYSKFSGLSNTIRKLEKELIIPINGKYTEILDGLPVIRAYNKIQQMITQFEAKVNTYSMAATIRFIIDARILLVIFISTNILAIVKVLSLLFLDDSFKNYSIFLIFNIFSLQDGLMKVNQNITVFGPVLDSLGKCEDLTKLEHQKGFDEYLNNNWNEDGPFQNVYFGKQLFPRGQIIFDHFSLRYKPDQQDVLNNLSFIINPGEKIGIVGRTGSGKSSLMLGLLRIIEGSSGRIIIDGMETKKLSLQQLRSNINIILQDHFLFTGTIRENVDPTGAHTDQQVENAIKLCGIWQGFNDGLDTKVTQGGDNLSSGQKQLINIARSLLSPKRIVLVDEATASIDIQTDELIQKVIKTQFADRTVLTIAHRINTVIESDRILVLGKGKIIQLDTPQNLLQTQNSVFAKLFYQSGKAKQE